MRHLIEYAAWLAAEAKPYGTEAAVVKILGGRTAHDTTNKMLQVHGGYGFSAEYSISRLYRDARALDLMGGTPQIQRVLIARDVFEDAGVKVEP